MSKNTAVRLVTALPAGEANGLLAHAAEFIATTDMKLAIVLLDTKETATNFDDGTVTAKVRVRRVEVIDGEDVAAVQAMMLRANGKRLGRTVLPLDLESDVTAIFAKFQHYDPEGDGE